MYAMTRRCVASFQTTSSVIPIPFGTVQRHTTASVSSSVHLTCGGVFSFGMLQQHKACISSGFHPRSECFFHTLSMA
jgi:hypothetical protein